MITRTTRNNIAGTENRTNNIIQFPKAHSNGYMNLTALFEVCYSVESCNFYLETAEQLYQNESITENEFLTLRRIGRQKRLVLANPKSQQIKADKPGTYMYTSEMGQEKPEGCQIEAGLSYYGKHYWLKTKLELKGRGITENAPYNDGFKSYTVTKRAFEILKTKYAISFESYLD